MLRVLLWCAALVQSFAPRFEVPPPRRRSAALPFGATPGADAATPAEATADAASTPHIRRKRYAGRYPRNFSERYKEQAGDAATVKRVLEKGGTPADLTHDVGKGFVWYLDADDGRRPRGNQPGAL